MRLLSILLIVLLYVSDISWSASQFQAGDTADRVFITDNPGLSLPDADWTVWCKIKPNTNTIAVDARFVSWSASSLGITMILPTSGGEMDEVQFYVSDDGVDFAQCTSTSSPFQGNTSWTDVAMIRSGTTMTGYVNASSVCSVSMSGIGAVDSSDNWNVGNRGSGSRLFPGDIAGCAIWHRALTITELTELLDGFSPLCKLSGIRMYLPLIGVYHELIGGMSVTNVNSVFVPHPRTYLCGE